MKLKKRNANVSERIIAKRIEKTETATVIVIAEIVTVTVTVTATEIVIVIAKRTKRRTRTDAEIAKKITTMETKSKETNSGR